MKRISAFSVALVALALISLASCATSRGVIDYRVDAGPNPASGKVVYLDNVSAARVFEAKPTEPSIPSLKDGQITNKEITSRAIARKRNGYGKALGDILLPEGRTVSDLFAEATVKALRDKGYVVVPKDSPEAKNGTPVSVTVNRFWCWMVPGFWAITLEGQVEVFVTGPAILVSGKEEQVICSISRKSAAGGTKAWTTIIDQSLQEYMNELKARIK